VGNRRAVSVVLIGVFKLVKSAALLALGVAAAVSAPQRLAMHVETALGWMGGLAARESLQRALVKLSSLGPAAEKRVAVLAIAYALIFLVEGLGLVARRRWAEWMTLGVTASFIPFEIYELVKGPTVSKVVALVVNAAILGYLAWRRFSERRGASGLFRRRPRLTLVVGGIERPFSLAQRAARRS
jgi:uncharacterized membrane protein (DUF2068 family)